MWCQECSQPQGCAAFKGVVHSAPVSRLRPRNMTGVTSKLFFFVTPVLWQKGRVRPFEASNVKHGCSANSIHHFPSSPDPLLLWPLPPHSLRRGRSGPQDLLWHRIQPRVPQRVVGSGSALRAEVQEAPEKVRHLTG